MHTEAIKAEKLTNSHLCYESYESNGCGGAG